MTLPDITRYDTLPKLLELHAAEHGGDIWLREKDLGIWNAYTWAEVARRVRHIALGLTGLGVSRGDVVALLGDNRPEWLMGEVAAHALGGMSLGIYRDALADEVAYLITYADVAVVFAEDEEQVDKLLQLEEKIPTVRHIVYSDPRGIRKYDDPRLVSLESLEEQGRARDAAAPSAYADMVAAGKGDDVAILCTTSGTTSHPKLAMLTGGALLRHCKAYLAMDPRGPDDEYVSVLQMPWIMEQIYAFGQAILSRMKVNFVEEPETMMADMREIGPTFVLFAPRVWEQIAADVRARMMDASALKRAMFHFGMALGLKALERGQRSALADFILFRALRDRLGFTRLKSAATGGAALGPDTFRFFLALGVPMRQLYGQTELLGAYTLHQAADVDFDTVGVPMEGVEIRIDDPDPNGLGEVVTRHPNMFTGYFGNAEETAKSFAEEGWMRTGDAGYFNDKGHLVVIDRIRDMAKTTQGDRFSPQYIENKLKFSPYVAEAVILGDGRESLAAIICIRFSIVSKWAEKQRIAFTTYTDLSAKPEVIALLRKEVEEVNKTLAAKQRVSRFLLLYKELDADDGELTRTRKVRRGVINERYGTIIDAMYQGAKVIDVDTTITFQDGTKQRIKTKLDVVELDTRAGTAATEAKRRAA
ncbi:long-chain fatty acid--CoA ligase [Xanthobacter tagetidis]|uniref:Long-chain fatty acid--CoA ligase n=1 Tax=Xanthobacter tagetidis TaxID=60216 RepID=A0A3L7A2K0_9HYPH|nr:long-chain fatty acid--CoA ligase [Xanthobacter tagetidis]MBB6309286.1 long-chain acyl-CoA synthetase [Xanthobacter tagetidis]RLP74240.1 long-chain fatty acid--CoA ligase [Xanthobacter tagetidis]